MFVEGEMFLTDTITADCASSWKTHTGQYRLGELAKICEHLGTNAWDVIKFANKHPRVNIHSLVLVWGALLGC